MVERYCITHLFGGYFLFGAIGGKTKIRQNMIQGITISKPVFIQNSHTQWEQQQIMNHQQNHHLRRCVGSLNIFY